MPSQLRHSGAAELLTIGDELCRGEIVDTNSSWLAAQLWDRSVAVRWMTSCRDDQADMARALREAVGRADLVLVSGGLGPTEDDLTVDVIAEVAGVGVVPDEPSLARMTARFERAKFTMTPNSLRQVRVPAGARVLANSAGIAPGFEVSLEGAAVFAMPGVPREMQAIFGEHIGPRLDEILAGKDAIARQIYRVFGAGESHIDHALAGIVAGVKGASVHYQVAFPETLVKLVVRDADAGAAAARLAGLETDLLARLGDKVYGEGADSLAGVLGRTLRDRKATLAVAESCTGGMLGSLITDVPGSSDYFLGGWQVYSNELKRRLLDVKEETLAGPGAVSQACVEELAMNARERSGASFAAAISGIAGPGGGTPDKPVGTVHIAVAGPRGLRHRQLVYPGARDQIRRLAAYWAMAMLLREAAQ